MALWTASPSSPLVHSPKLLEIDFENTRSSTLLPKGDLCTSFTRSLMFKRHISCDPTLFSLQSRSPLSFSLLHHILHYGIYCD